MSERNFEMTKLSGDDMGEDLMSIDYLPGFYHEQAPVHLNFICALHGIQGPRLSTSFDYCEIGCGVGETTCILAASNPHSCFVGIDLSPSHIVKAKALAAIGKLTNARFIAADIASLDHDQLLQFDFITIHGVYAWVSRNVQRAILKFIREKLKAGGVVYLSYNALPGWAAAAPVRNLFAELASRMGGELVSKPARVMESLVRMHESGALYFAENPIAVRVLDQIRDADSRYLVHEFLSPNWAPLYFADVCRDMNEAGLEYVGDGKVLDNLIEYSTVPEFIGLLREINDPLLRETIHDYALNRPFRRDVYVKDIGTEQREQRLGSLRNILFGMELSPLEIRGTVLVSGGQELDLGGRLLERLKEVLERSAMHLHELAADPVLRDCPKDELTRVLLLLSSGVQISPFTRRGFDWPDWAAGEDRVRIVPTLNRHLLERNTEAKLVLASPAKGSGIVVGALEALLLQSLTTEEPVQWTWRALCRSDRKMVAKGVAVEGEKQNVAAISDALAQFRAKKLPKLAYLGVVEPAAAT